MKALLILAQKDYQDLEYAGTRSGLESAGYEITIASSEACPCVGKFGDHVEAQISLKDVDVTEFEKIAFIGGPGACGFINDPEAQRIARETIEQGKKLGAICIAPTILASAGVLQGKNATVWNGDGQQSSVLESAGASFTGEDVTVDGDIVTANGPPAAERFGEVFAAL